MQIARRLFVVPLANNDHGKTTMLRALVNQGQGSALKANHKKKPVADQSMGPADRRVRLRALIPGDGEEATWAIWQRRSGAGWQ